MNKSYFIFIILLCFCLCFNSFAQDKDNVLIINSDSNVEKYKEISEIFKNNWTGSVSEYNMDTVSTSKTIQELIKKGNYNLIYCIGSKAYINTYPYVKKEKIIFSSILNCFRLPLNKNTYGIANEVMEESQITLFKYIFPKINKIGILYNSKYNEEWVKKSINVAKDMNIEIIKSKVDNSYEVITKLSDLVTRCDAMWLIPDPVVLENIETISEIFKTCDKYLKPIFTYSDIFEDYGAVLMISADSKTIGQQALILAEKIIAGEVIQNNIQYPIGSSVAFNLSKAEKYGLIINKNALSSVNRIIEK